MLRKRHLSAILSLFMLLLVTAGGNMDGFVLCITQDGRVAVEATSGTCCDSAVFAVDPSGNPSTREASGEDDHHCDSCVDVPLLTSVLIHQSTHNASSQLRVANLASAPFVAARFRCIAKSGLSSLPPSTTKTTLASLRTVSLLI